MPILGMKGTGDYTLDVERPKNWREMILFLFPNGESPLTALLSKLRGEGTDDPVYNWFEKELPTQRVKVNGAHTDSVVTIDLQGANLEKNFKLGHLVMNERTNEIFRVQADPAIANEITTVERESGETAKAAMVNGDDLVIIGSAYEEGSDMPTPVSYSPTNLFNYTQIFRTPLSITRTAKKTRMRTGDTYEEAKREALQLHGIEMEKAFIWGQRSLATRNGQLYRQTRGMKTWITTNTADLGGTVTEPEWDGKMEEAFRYGSQEKLGMIGSTALNTLNQLAKNKTKLEAVPGSEVYGMSLIRYISPFGVLYLRMHPLFNAHPDWRKNLLIIDVDKVRFRYVDDTDFYINRQATGKDAREDEFLTEAGLEIHHEKAHAWYTNITSFAP